MKERAEDLLRDRFHSQQAEFSCKSAWTDSTNSDDIIEVSVNLVKKKLPKVFDLYKRANTSSDLGELERYLQGLDPLNCDDPEELLDPQCALDWWKVGLFSNMLTIIIQRYWFLSDSFYNTGAWDQVSSFVQFSSRLPQNNSLLSSGWTTFYSGWASLFCKPSVYASLMHWDFSQ